MRFLVAGLIALIFTAQAHGQPRQDLGAWLQGQPAAAALSGSELLFTYQGGMDKQLSVSTLLNSSRAGSVVNVVTYGADPTGVADSTSAINTAISSNPGKCVYAPGGTYKTSSEIVMHSNGACFYGDGPNATILSATGATQNGVHIVTSGTENAYLANLKVVNTSSPPTGGAGIAVDINASGVVIYNVISRNNFVGFSLAGSAGSQCILCSAVLNYSDGFLFTNGIAQNVMQWIVSFAQSSANNGWGYNMNSSVAGVTVPPYFTTVASFANTAGGYSFGGVSGTLYTDNLMSSVTSSGDGGGGGVSVSAPGPRFHLSGLYIESAGQFNTGVGFAASPAHTGCGISISGPGSADTTIEITDTKVWGNSFQGVCFASGPTVARAFLNGVYAINNGLSGSTFGIDLESTTTQYFVTSSYAFNASGSSQTFGLKAANGSNVYLANSDFLGNATGGCTFTSNVPNGTSAGTGCQGNINVNNLTANTNVSSGTMTIANSGSTPFGTAPAQLMANTSSGADAKSWYSWVSTAGVWNLCATNDAFNACNNAVSITRSGNTPILITFPGMSLVVGAAAATVSAGQVSYGSTTVAAGSGTCPTGTVGSQTVAGCIVVNIAGTNRNVPFF